MILQIANLLTTAEILAIQEQIADDGLWRDGADTAKGRARVAKNNEQARPESPAIKGVLDKIRQTVLANKTFTAATQPASIARLMLSRYSAGMRYGAHVDAPYIDGVRTDISFTLFLNDVSEYDGGELVIDTAGAEDAVKLPAGSVVLYPSTSVHRVEEVKCGIRLAAVGWIKSRIRLAEHRSILFDLEVTLADLAHIEIPASSRDRLINMRNNLLRALGD